MNLTRQKYFMTQAIKQSNLALKLSEVPVGAIIVDKDENIIGMGHNSSISNNNPTAHAEVNAIIDACKNKKNYRLNDCSLFVTLEPCLMCAGAIIHARIKTVVIMKTDPKSGCVLHNPFAFKLKKLNHHPEVIILDMNDDTLSNFFKNK